MNEHLIKNWLKHSHELPSKSHPFNSSSPRTLNHLQPSSPGPGAYNPPIKDIQRTSLYHVAPEKRSAIEQEFQWMFSRQRQSGLTQKENNILLGPGAYDFHEQQKTPKNSWSKADRFKTAASPLANDSPGPGYYESSPKNHNHASGAQFVFKSRLKKDLQLSREKPFPKEASQDQRLRYPDIQQADSSQIKDTKRTQEKSSFFASKVPRFMTESGVSYVGPGSYHIDGTQRSRVKTQLPRMVRFKPSKAPMFCGKAESHVGPGSYNINKYNLCRELEFKGYAVSRETRFNFKGKQSRSAILPGPGAYMQNKYVYIKEEELLRRKMHRKVKNGSQIGMRQNQRAPKTPPQIKMGRSSGPGLYNLNAYDIASRLKKRLQHAQKLRLMDISVPAFNSNAPRLIS